MRNTCVVLEGHEEKHPRWPLAETTTTTMQEKKDKTQKGKLKCHQKVIDGDIKGEESIMDMDVLKAGLRKMLLKCI